MKEYMKKFADKIDYVINIESHNIGRITNKAMGQYRAEINIDTKLGGHSFRDFGRPNAIIILSQIINDLSQIKFPKYSGKTTWNIGKITGGENINSIPRISSALVEIRSENNQSLNLLKSNLANILKKYKKTYNKVDLSLNILSENPFAEYSSDNKLYDIILDSQKTLGIKSKFDSGNTDGDVSLSMGIPTATIGSSIGFNTHSLKEYVEKKSITLGAKQAFLVIRLSLNKL